jgi:hypothetical protein
MTTKPGKSFSRSSETSGLRQRDEDSRRAEDVSVREFLTAGAREGLATDRIFPDDTLPVVRPSHSDS